jgi:hypothetical protein
MSATSYCHLASAAGDLAVETLQAQDFFKHGEDPAARRLAPIELITETVPV